MNPDISNAEDRMSVVDNFGIVRGNYLLFVKKIIKLLCDILVKVNIK